MLDDFESCGHAVLGKDNLSCMVKPVQQDSGQPVAKTSLAQQVNMLLVAFFKLPLSSIFRNTLIGILGVICHSPIHVKSFFQTKQQRQEQSNKLTQFIT